jgi:thioredoxin-related protein
MTATGRTALILASAAIFIAALPACSKEEDTPDPAGKAQPSWHVSLAGARLDARKRGTLILVDCHATQDSWRTKPEKDILEDPAVEAKLMQFTLVRRIGTEYSSHRDDFKVWRFPTRLVLDEKGEVISRRDGQMSSRELVAFLDRALKGEKEPKTDLAMNAAIEAALDKLPWNKTLDEAMAEAEKRQTLILINVHSERCPFCVALAQDTLTNDAVQAGMKEFALFSMKLSEHPELAKRYGLRGSPTTVVAGRDGSLIAKRPGYITPRDYIAFLEAARHKAIAPAGR